MNWYVVRTQNNREKSVGEKLHREKESILYRNKIGEILIPTEKVYQTRKDKKVQVERVTFPGYIFLETNAVAEVKQLLRNINGAQGFLTDRRGQVQQLKKIEVDRMIDNALEKEASYESTFNVGEEVIINEGAFSSMKGTVEEVEENKLKLSVSIFGRKTQVEVGKEQVDKI